MPFIIICLETKKGSMSRHRDISISYEKNVFKKNKKILANSPISLPTNKNG